MVGEGHRRANSSSCTGAALPPRTSSTARPRGKEAPGVGVGGTGVGATPAGNSSRYPPGGMPPPPQQQQPGGDGGGFLSRITNKLKGTDGPPMGGAQSGQGYGGGRYGGGGGGGSQQYPSQGGTPQGWQPPSRPGMALQATGPSRGPIQRDMGYQGQDGGYGGHQQAYQQHQQPGGGGDGPGIWSRFKGKVFQGDANGEAEDGPPSFRPGGSVLKKKEESVASANIQAFGGPGAYGNPFPSFAGPPGLGGGQPDGPTPDLAGPGAPEVISVDGSIVMVLKPNDLAKKKRKFKQAAGHRDVRPLPDGVLRQGWQDALSQDY
ncbi:unnamed protein product [Ectocarpus sp. CCAP 1310/34]|nr:unnamed protein product [Ectocarpus sp. CCAP 1310/34]